MPTIINAPAAMPIARSRRGIVAAPITLRFRTTSQVPIAANPMLETSPAKKKPVVPETTSAEPHHRDAGTKERCPDHEVRRPGR